MSDVETSTALPPAGGAGDPGGDVIVSIVMPMLNEERHIRRCLESVLAQRFDMSRVEILVVDGGSTDGSSDVVREFAAAHPRITLLHNPFRYQSHALNIAVPRTRGKYVLRMDCHSSYEPDYIARLVEAFERTGADNIQGPNISYPGANTTAARAIWLVQGSRLGGGASFGRQEGGQGRFLGPGEVTSGWSFTRDILDRAGPFDERLIRNQDNEYTCRVRAIGGRAWYEPAVRAAYYARATVPAFVRLMFRNGFFHMLTWRVCPESFGLTHCVPAGFVLTLLVLGIAASFVPYAGWLLAAVVALYGAAVLMETLRAAASHGARYTLWLPWLFPLMHLSYGVGTLLGIARFVFTLIERTDDARRYQTRTLEQEEKAKVESRRQ